MTDVKTDDKGKYVIVEQGDTLSKIASNSTVKSITGNATYRTLAEWNSIANPDLIYPGQKIYLKAPGKSSTTTSSMKTVKLSKINRMASNGNNVFVTWEWDKHGRTENYTVEWGWKTEGDWFYQYKTESTTYQYSIFAIPESTSSISCRVKPINKSSNSGSNKFSEYYCSKPIFYEGKIPESPNSLKIELNEDGTQVTVSVSGINSDADIIEFELVKDDKTDKTSKQKVSEGSASVSWKSSYGSVYKARCRGRTSSGATGAWSAYSNEVATAPPVPSGLKAKSELVQSGFAIKVSWNATTSATGYDLEYTTEPEESNRFVEGSDNLTKQSCESTSYLITKVDKDVPYYIRLRAKNSSGESDWTAPIEGIVAGTPAAPTTWSSSTVVGTNDPLILYWVHNADDGGSEKWAVLEYQVDDGAVTQITFTKSEADIAAGVMSSYVFPMLDDDGSPLYPLGAKLLWRVKTAAVATAEGTSYGDFSEDRIVNIYTQPTLTMTVTDGAGKKPGSITNGEPENLTAFPIRVAATTSPDTQKAVTYHVSIHANDAYDITDNVGNDRTVISGTEVYSKYFDSVETLNTTISAGDVQLEDGISYTMKCVASMDSGLTAESNCIFTVVFEDVLYSPNALVTIDADNLSANVMPHCSKMVAQYYQVDSNYKLTTTKFATVYPDKVVGSLDTGEVIYSGTADGFSGTRYFALINVEERARDVLLSVYRREFDGTFTELYANLDGALNISVTDPHPALDYARYRIVATSKITGAMSFYDTPGEYIGGKEIVLQWEGEISAYNQSGLLDVDDSSTVGGVTLKLPYNIDVSNSHKTDVSLVEYIGRRHPVSYYGTQVGETATWNVDIPKSDKETLYMLRQLAIWTGDVYVREPSGSGYWANVSVSFSQKHRELTIPVTLSVTRVEGGA